MHRAALQDSAFTETVVTKSFSGRYARGLRNRFIDEHEAEAPFGYPEVHYLTSPLRAASVRAGDPHAVNVWAGTGFREARGRSGGRDHANARLVAIAIPVLRRADPASVDIMPTFTRREFTLGVGVFAAATLIPGCSSGSDGGGRAAKNASWWSAPGWRGSSRRDGSRTAVSTSRCWTHAIGSAAGCGPTRRSGSRSTSARHGSTAPRTTHSSNSRSRSARKDVETDFDKPVLFRDGTEVSSEDVQATLKHWGEITKELATLSADAGEDESVANGLAQVADLNDPLVEWCVASEIVGEYAADPDELSLKWFGNEGEFGGPDVILPGGYQELAKHLARGLTIRLATEVTRITYDGSGVRLETSQGVVDADRAIVTVPLGVLKAGTIAFDPPLPEEKRLAIERLGFGLLDKVVLKFDQPFWPETDVIGLVGRDQPVSMLINGTVFAGTPLLVGLRGGHDAREREALSDAGGGGASGGGAERTEPDRSARHPLGSGPIRARLL